VECRSLRTSLVSSMSASHSLWKEASMPGMEVAAAGLGFTALLAEQQGQGEQALEPTSEHDLPSE